MKIGVNAKRNVNNLNIFTPVSEVQSKPNQTYHLSSPYYAEACNELGVSISAS